MRIREQVFTCLEMATAEYHQFGTAEQLKRPGEKAKITAIARKMPQPLLRTVIDTATKDTVPVKGGRKGKTVLAYGAEAIVISSGASDDEKVVKLFHRQRPPGAYQETSRRLQGYFGCLLEPILYFEYQSPHKAGASCTGAIQRKVDGTDFFDDPSKANPEDVLKLWSGASNMRTKDGDILDILGYRNVLVDNLGAIRIVDHGIATLSSEQEVQTVALKLDALQAAVNGV